MSPTTSTKVVAFAAAVSSLQAVMVVGAISPMDTFRSYLPKDAGLPETDDDPEWTFRRTKNDGEEPYGPSEWYLGYPDCSGSAQSPINLSADLEVVPEASVFQLEFYGTECTLDTLSFSADGDHWQVGYENCLPAPSLQFNTRVYELQQFHIHSPSEHMVGGSSHDAEIHFVHENSETAEVLVVGIFLDVREYGSNVVLEPLWDILNSGATETADTTSTKAYDLLPASKEYAHYHGSFTTPPCTEGVKWVVMTSPTVIGKMQIDEFRASISGFENSKVDERSNTNRPCQELNGRPVYLV